MKLCLPSPHHNPQGRSTGRFLLLDLPMEPAPFSQYHLPVFMNILHLLWSRNQDRSLTMSRNHNTEPHRNTPVKHRKICSLNHNHAHTPSCFYDENLQLWAVITNTSTGTHVWSQRTEEHMSADTHECVCMHKHRHSIHAHICKCTHRNTHAKTIHTHTYRYAHTRTPHISEAHAHTLLALPGQCTQLWPSHGVHFSNLPLPRAFIS